MIPTTDLRQACNAALERGASRREVARVVYSVARHINIIAPEHRPLALKQLNHLGRATEGRVAA